MIFVTEMPRFYPRVSSSSKSSSSGAMWKCAFCGAMNEDENMVCDGCGDERPLVPQTASSKPTLREDFEDMSSAPSTPPASAKAFDDDKEDENLEATGKDGDEDSSDDSESAKLSTDDDFEQDETSTQSDLFGSQTDRDDGTSSDFSTESLITSPTPSPSIPSSSPEPMSSYAPPAYSSPASTADTGRYYLVFINTPAQSLIKSRVAIEFDDFPVITIGRNPENIVVIPDQEVSRKHAELSVENGRLMVKDLKSANGTYIYDGKQFQRVNGSVELKPNSILKFGSGTIVRLENG